LVFLQIKSRAIDSFLFIKRQLKPFLTPFVKHQVLKLGHSTLLEMEMNEDNRDPKSANSEDYDPNHPQDLNKPVFNSTTDHRSTKTLPGVENLNQQLENEEEETRQDTSRLSGSDRKTDLGNDNDKEADEDDERIISR